MKMNATISIDSNKYYLSDFGPDNGYQFFKEGPLTTSEKIDCAETTEWEAVGAWMWKNREVYNGLSVLPFFGGSYQQAPFEDITEEEYNKRITSLTSIDLSKVTEVDDNVEFTQTASCAGGACEINI